MWIRRLRLWSGLVLAIYVSLHLLNHAFGLLSLDFMDTARPYLTSFWSFPPLAILLYLSILVHVVLAFYALYKRSTLRMPIAEALQLGMGLLIPFILIPHIIATRITDVLTDVQGEYQLVMNALWSDSYLAMKQGTLVVLVWFHVCIGLHFWLRSMKSSHRWYGSYLPFWTVLAVMLPVLSLLGYSRAGLEIVQAGSSQVEQDVYAYGGYEYQTEPQNSALLAHLKNGTPWVLGGLIFVVLGLRYLRLRSGISPVRVIHPLRNVSMLPGQTVLEALRVAGVPHMSFCGGRARCTTCRIWVGSDQSKLPEPEILEQTALSRIGAPKDVRLACQLRPTHDIHITPLVPTNEPDKRQSYKLSLAGREQSVAIMFIDLRDSTALAEARLPYDVVYIVNAFMAEMASALEETRGVYATFTGDGFMAIYGLDIPLSEGCRNALNGAALMGERLERLNLRLESEFGIRLRMGIGINSGDVIAGSMGPPDATHFSALGDTVNVAARLESLCKKLSCNVVISSDVARHAGVDTGKWRRDDVSIAGRTEKVGIYMIDDLASLSADS